MTLGWLIAQSVLYLVIFAVSVYCIFINDDYNTTGIVVLIAGTIINVVISFCVGWCFITGWLASLAVTASILIIAFVTESESFTSLGVLLASLVVVALLSVVCIYLFGGKMIAPSKEIAYVKEERVYIISSGDKGIADTTVSGRSNLLFGSVSGTTKLTYYYSYYYQAEDGALNIGTIPASITKLYTISDDEQPYVILKTNQHKTISILTGLPTEDIQAGDSYYELYVPESAIPTDFTYNLN